MTCNLSVRYWEMQGSICHLSLECHLPLTDSPTSYLSSSAALSSPPNPNPLRNLVLHDVAQSGWLLEVGGEAGDDREADPQS